MSDYVEVTSTMMQVRHLAAATAPVERWNNGMTYRRSICGVPCPYGAETLKADLCKRCAKQAFTSVSSHQKGGSEE